jgi:lambda family phage portal protein
MSEAFDGLRVDYAAAKSSRYRRRRTGTAPMGSGADYHYRTQADYLRLIELARDMDRNDVVVGQTVDRAVANTIQDGLKLNAKTGDEDLNKDLESRWKAWAEEPEACDVSGELSFPDMESLALRHAFIDGDLIALGVNSGALELIEAHRVRTPTTKRNVVHGVLLSKLRRRLEYWVTRDDVNPLNSARLRVGDTVQHRTRDAAGNRQVFHVYNPKRVTQTRGVTAFAPIFDSLGMFEDINFSRLVQQQIVSCFAIFRQREIESIGVDNTQTGSQHTDTLADGTERTIEGIAPGMQITGLPGEKLTGFTPNVPNPEFFPHARLVLTLIGINLGMPLVLVLLDASETNFSGYRGAVDQARLGFKHNQSWLTRRFHRPVYHWQVRRWVAQDRELRRSAARLEAMGGSILSHEWERPGWPYIEPLKDAKADGLRLDKNLTSPRRLQAQRGANWGEMVGEIVDDNAKLIEAAIERADVINKQHGEGTVDWHELVNKTPTASTDVIVDTETDRG